MNPKRSSVYYVFGLCVIGILTPLAVSVMAQSEESIPMEFPEPDAGNLRTFIELVRSDVRTQKAYILAQNLYGDGTLGSTAVFDDGFESGDTSGWSATVP